MPLHFILLLFIRFSASVKNQTSQPLSWVKRRKWAFGPGGTVYKELVRFQRCFEVSSTQETVCHYAKAQHRSTDSLAFPPFIWVERGKEGEGRGSVRREIYGFLPLGVSVSTFNHSHLSVITTFLYLTSHKDTRKTNINLSDGTGDIRETVRLCYMCQ